jgi:hypothetical protein
MSKLVFFTLLLTMAQAAVVPASSEEGRTLSGIIYFTNNSPRNMDTFPVELYTPDEKRRVAATTPDAHGRFALQGLKPGKYLLKFTWPPRHCVLRYRADVRQESKTGIRVIMDADCSSRDGKTQDLEMH